jgi:hypothetical protein
MMMKMKSWMLGAAAVASVFAAAPAAAVQVVFAQIDLLDADRNFVWSRVSGANINLGTSATPFGAAGLPTQVLFSLVGSSTPLSVTADLLITGSFVSGPLGTSSGAFSQAVNTFGFNITATSSFCWVNLCFNPGDSLLSGSVQNSAITGTLGTRTADFTGSTAGGATISYSSPLLSFDPTATYSFDFGLTNIDRNLTGTTNSTLGSFRSQISGTFSSEPGAVFNVPEPGTWAMMIIGMGLVGAARRRRRKVVAA